MRISAALSFALAACLSPVLAHGTPNLATAKAAAVSLVKVDKAGGFNRLDKPVIVDGQRAYFRDHVDGIAHDRIIVRKAGSTGMVERHFDVRDGQPVYTHTVVSNKSLQEGGSVRVYRGGEVSTVRLRDGERFKEAQSRDADGKFEPSTQEAPIKLH